MKNSSNLLRVFGIALFSASMTVPFAYGETFQYESKGKRDPFVPLIGSGKVVTAGLEDILSIEDVNLEGIAIGAKGKRVVIINGQLLTENDKVGNLAVKHISKKTVTISIDDKEYILGLPEEGGIKSEK